MDSPKNKPLLEEPPITPNHQVVLNDSFHYSSAPTATGKMSSACYYDSSRNSLFDKKVITSTQILPYALPSPKPAAFRLLKFFTRDNNNNYTKSKGKRGQDSKDFIGKTTTGQINAKYKPLKKKTADQSERNITRIPVKTDQKMIKIKPTPEIKNNRYYFYSLPLLLQQQQQEEKSSAYYPPPFSLISGNNRLFYGHNHLLPPTGDILRPLSALPHDATTTAYVKQLQIPKSIGLPPPSDSRDNLYDNSSSNPFKALWLKMLCNCLLMRTLIFPSTSGSSLPSSPSPTGGCDSLLSDKLQDEPKNVGKRTLASRNFSGWRDKYICLLIFSFICVLLQIPIFVFKIFHFFRIQDQDHLQNQTMPYNFTKNALFQSY